MHNLCILVGVAHVDRDDTADTLSKYLFQYFFIYLGKQRANDFQKWKYSKFKGVNFFFFFFFTCKGFVMEAAQLVQVMPRIASRVTTWSGSGSFDSSAVLRIRPPRKKNQIDEFFEGRKKKRKEKFLLPRKNISLTLHSIHLKTRNAQCVEQLILCCFGQLDVGGSLAFDKTRIFE